MEYHKALYLVHFFSIYRWHKNACPDTNIKLFADDANVFVEGDSEFKLTDKVNKLLDKLSLWCTANKLSLSPDKTCYSIFGNYSHIGNIKTISWWPRIS